MTNKLFPFRKLFLLLTLLFAMAIVYGLVFLSANEQNVFVLPSFLAMLWSLLCFLFLGFAQKFAAQYEPNSIASKSLWQRFKLKIQRGLYYLLGLVFLGLTLTIILLTSRVLKTLF